MAAITGKFENVNVKDVVIQPTEGGVKLSFFHGTNTLVFRGSQFEVAAFKNDLLEGREVTFTEREDPPKKLSPVPMPDDDDDEEVPASEKTPVSRHAPDAAGPMSPMRTVDVGTVPFPDDEDDAIVVEDNEIEVPDIESSPTFPAEGAYPPPGAPVERSLPENPPLTSSSDSTATSETAADSTPESKVVVPPYQRTFGHAPRVYTWYPASSKERTEIAKHVNDAVNGGSFPQEIRVPDEPPGMTWEQIIKETKDYEPLYGDAMNVSMVVFGEKWGWVAKTRREKRELDDQLKRLNAECRYRDIPIPSEMPEGKIWEEEVEAYYAKLRPSPPPPPPNRQSPPPPPPSQRPPPVRPAVLANGASSVADPEESKATKVYPAIDGRRRSGAPVPVTRDEIPAPPIPRSARLPSLRPRPAASPPPPPSRANVIAAAEEDALDNAQTLVRMAPRDSQSSGGSDSQARRAQVVSTPPSEAQPVSPTEAESERRREGVAPTILADASPPPRPAPRTNGESPQPAPSAETTWGFLDQLDQDQFYDDLWKKYPGVVTIVGFVATAVIVYFLLQM